jgi:hypothetical protein
MHSQNCDFFWSSGSSMLSFSMSWITFKVFPKMVVLRFILTSSVPMLHTCYICVLSNTCYPSTFLGRFGGVVMTRVWTQGFIVTKQALYHLSHTSRPRCCSYFGSVFPPTIRGQCYIPILDPQLLPQPLLKKKWENDRTIMSPFFLGDPCMHRAVCNQC